ncbi:two-component regulator propeller domain-containing protein [Parafilimonas sp.]|uniref:two-component regulator propeller domain-containing protein n=1 Tax=Parafilimonas sp. TaxID=1969739 RepID=UPI0039E508D7
MLSKLLIAVICLIISCTALANNQPVIYIGIENGLSNNSVTTVFQDHRGFIWFGTYDGLNRYDGYYFKVFRNHLNDSNSLPNNRIAAIIEDDNKRLWVGTRSGVAIYDQVTSAFSPVYYTPGKAAAPRKINSIVNQIMPCGKGNMFIATDNGLLLYEAKTNMAGPVLINKQYSYQAMATECDNAKRTWVYVRERGLFLYDTKTQSLQLVDQQVKNGICLRAYTSDTLLMGTDDGLYAYAINTKTVTKKFSSGNRVLQLKNYGNSLYIVTDGNGIFVMNNAGGQIQNLFRSTSVKNLTSPCVYSILKDNNGRLWIGTMRGGINLIDAGRNKFETITHPLTSKDPADDFVTCMVEDNNHDLWIGTDGHGLNCWNRKLNTFTSYCRSAQTPQRRSSNFITSVLNEGDNRLWVASWGGGIDLFNKQTHRFTHFKCINTATAQEDKNPFLLYRDKQQRVWAGACLEGGLYRFNPQLQQFELYDARLKNILAMYQDNSNCLWAGDFSSLIQIDEQHKTFKRHHLGYAVRSIVEDKKGNFWIGTEGGGLLLFNRSNGSYKRYDESEGLSNNSVLKMLEDNRGNLWMSTFNGISVFNAITGTFRNFSQSDGLQSNQFNYNAGLRLSSGQFVFGGIKGMNIFYPDSILNRKADPLTVLLVGLRIDNIPIETSSRYITKRSADDIKSIKLPFDKAVLSFDFVALNYAASDKIRYAWYLEGWDKSWNYAGNIRTANYTRLNEGTYTFHIKAMNACGNESGWQQHLVIEVLPPWYRSWWSYLIYTAIAGALIYLYARYKSLKAKHKYEIALVKIETEKEKELNEKKLLFFTNIAHEFRTPLTLIIDPVKELLHFPEKRQSASGLHIVYRNARRLLSLVDQLLLFRKADTEGDKLSMERINFYELCHEVFICFSRQAKARNLYYEFVADDVKAEIAGDREKIEIILYNLISNALKFTPAGGTVKLEIVWQPLTSDTVEIIISDTGCGIEKSVGNKLFRRFYQAEGSRHVHHKGFGIGLYLANQFVKAHQGRLSYESEPGRGTKFTVSLPLNLPVQLPANEAWKINEAERKPVLIEELIAGLEADDVATNAEKELPEAVTGKELPAIAHIITEKKSILIVDDNKDIRQYLGQLFEDRFLVHEANSGEAGLQIAQQRLPDIIICDVIMNGITGFELCALIKADASLSHIPVILLTATTSSEIKLKGLECGADDYITKPFEKELLIARVENILKNRSALQQYFLDTVTLRKNNTKVSESYRDFLEKCIAVVEGEIENENFTIKSFARAMGMSHSSLYEKVKSVSGLSLSAFIRFLRLRRAALLLLTTDMNINEAAMQVGINDIKYFRRQFNKLFGMNPSEYIKRYKDSFNKSLNVAG